MRYSKFVFFILFVVAFSSCAPAELEPDTVVEMDAAEVEAETEVENESSVEEPLEESQYSDETVEETKPVVETKSAENWDHISESLTKYLIWWGDTVAMVENCPGGYYEAYGAGSGIYHCDDEENSWLQFEWLDGTAVRVPGEAGQQFLWDRKNPGGSTFQQTMTADEKYWIYLDWTSDESRLVAYDVKAATENVLMSFTAIDYNEAYCSGTRFFGWNESRTKLGILARNESDEVNYPEASKVFILTIEDGKLIKKSKYNLPVLPDCSPNNGPFFAIDWVDDDTIGYYDYNEAWAFENPEYFETLFWSDDPWGSEYAHFYDVD